MPVKTVSLLSLQLAGRPTALLSGSLWLETDDSRQVRRWGVNTVLERPISFPDSADVPLRAKSGPHIVQGTATIGEGCTLPGGYYSLRLQGAGGLRGAEALI